MGVRSRLAAAAEWLLDRVCRERVEVVRANAGGTKDLYLVRWVLWGRAAAGDGRRVFVHRFLRSDYDTLHDHPWPFWSLILWGGYWENTRGGRKWYGPGRLLRRPAEWRHRVELPPGKGCWSLLWVGAKVRSWGFWCADHRSPGGRFVPHREFGRDLDAGGDGCGGGAA